MFLKQTIIQIKNRNKDRLKITHDHLRHAEYLLVQTAQEKILFNKNMILYPLCSSKTPKPHHPRSSFTCFRGSSGWSSGEIMSVNRICWHVFTELILDALIVCLSWCLCISCVTLRSVAIVFRRSAQLERSFDWKNYMNVKLRKFKKHKIYKTLNGYQHYRWLPEKVESSGP